MRSRRNVKMTSTGRIYWIDNSNIIYLSASRKFYPREWMKYLQQIVDSKRIGDRKCPNLD